MKPAIFVMLDGCSTDCLHTFFNIRSRFLNIYSRNLGSSLIIERHSEIPPPPLIVLIAPLAPTHPY